MMGPVCGCATGAIVHQYGSEAVYSASVPFALRILSIAALLAALGVACGESSPSDVAAPGPVDATPSDPAASSDGAGETTDAADEAAERPATSPDSSVSVEWVHGWSGDLIDGGQIDANSLAGQDVVLWFWAPW
jgi:hypothetical protein